MAPTVSLALHIKQHVRAGLKDFALRRLPHDGVVAPEPIRPASHVGNVVALLQRPCRTARSATCKGSTTVARYPSARPRHKGCRSAMVLEECLRQTCTTDAEIRFGRWQLDQISYISTFSSLGVAETNLDMSRP